MNKVPIVTLMAAVVISGFGSFISSIALPWLVLQYNHSATDAGIAAFFATLPVFLNGAFGGAVVDAVGAKRTSIVSDIMAGMTISMIPLLALFDCLSFPSILAVAFFAKLFESPGGTARLSMIVGVAEAADWSLAKANATLSAAARSAGLLGPAAAGAIIALTGQANAFWIDMATFWIAAVLVHLFIPARVVKADRAGSGEVETWFSKVSVGFAKAWTDPAMRSLTALVMMQSILISTLFSVLLPIYVDRQFHNPEALGVMVAAFGGGALVGSLLYVTYASRLSLARTLFLSCAVVSVALFAIVLSSDLYVSIAALAVGGLAISPVGPAAFAFIGHRFPAHMRGRVLAAFGAAAASGIPLGAIGIGFAVQLAGVHVVLGSSAMLFATLAVYSTRALTRSGA